MRHHNNSINPSIGYKFAAWNHCPQEMETNLIKIIFSFYESSIIAPELNTLYLTPRLSGIWPH
jgi:hypothetical protein